MTPLDAPPTDPAALRAATARFLAAAAEEAEVVYAELDSPVGPIGIPPSRTVGESR